MKRIALLFGLLFALTARANDVETDVTTVHTDASATELTDAHSPRHHRRHNARRKHRSGADFGDFHVGFVTALGAPAGMNVDFWSSGEIGFAPVAYRWYTRSGKQNVSVPFGFNWRNYRMTGTKRFFKDEQNHTVITDYPENVDIDFSRIKVFSLTLPLSYTFCPARRAAVSLSAIPSFNTYASLKTRYRDSEGKKHKEVQKKIHQTPFTVDFRMMAVYRGVGAYVKYSPFNVLNTNHGPEFQGLSVGVVFLP